MPVPAPGRLFSFRFRAALMAVWIGLGWSSLLPLLAADRITAFRDSRGRVVFVNEQPPEPLQSTAISTAADGITEVPETLDGVIASAAQRHQVDPDLVRAVVRVESNFNPRAVSPSGAMGLMQLVPATARRFGVGNAFDPGANVDGGVRYLKHLMTMFRGDLRLSLAAYNAGENAVGRYRGVPPYEETRNYLRKISQHYSIPSSQPAVVEKEQKAEIAKFVDEKGIVHFTNTLLP